MKPAFLKYQRIKPILRHSSPKPTCLTICTTSRKAEMICRNLSGSATLSASFYRNCLTDTPFPSAQDSDYPVTSEEFSFSWKLHNFSSPNGVQRMLLQSQIFAGGSSASKWRLQVDPSEQMGLSLYLELVSGGPTPVPAKFELSMLNGRSKRFSHSSGGWCKFLPGVAWGFEGFSGSIPLRTLLAVNSVTFLCEVSVAADPEPRMREPQHSLSEDLGSLFENQRFSDVTFSVDGKELRAHKAILSARSAVFAAMFQHEMAERVQNRVVVTDLDYDVFREMLAYVYTGEAPNIESATAELLVAADKYDLRGLKVKCERVLCGALNAENAVDILELADRHCAELLKAEATRFLRI